MFSLSRLVWLIQARSRSEPFAFLWTQFSNSSSTISGSSFRKASCPLKARCPAGCCWPWLPPVAAERFLSIAIRLSASKDCNSLLETPASPPIASSILLCLLFALLRPSLHVATLLPRENIAALLFDDSGSMTIQDAAGKSRLDAVKQFLDPKRSQFPGRCRKEVPHAHVSFFQKRPETGVATNAAG